MGNFRANVNLLKLAESQVVELEGINYLTIPVKKNDIYLSKDRNTGQIRGAYLNLTMWETPNNQYGSSHLIKQDFSKEYLEANPNKAKNAPILGNAKTIVKNANNSVSQSGGINNTVKQETPAQPPKQYEKPKPVYNEPNTNVDDLPF